MSCDSIDERLVGFHFGALPAEAAEEVEAHLLGCPRCLRAYFDFKRDSGGPPGEPSRESAGRLRAEIARELRAGRKRSPRGDRAPRWRERWLPLSIAAALLFAVMGSTYALSTQPLSIPLADGRGLQRPSDPAGAGKVE